VTTTTTTTTTTTPTFNPTTTTSSGGTPSGAGAPVHNVDPRVSNFSTHAEQSQYAMGANPNCTSYRSFEGFGGRPCGWKADGPKTRRNVVQSSGGSSVGGGKTKTVAKKTGPKSPV